MSAHCTFPSGRDFPRGIQALPKSSQAHSACLDLGRVWINNERNPILCLFCGFVQKVAELFGGFTTIFNIDTPIGTKTVEIPNSVKDIFLNEAQVPEDNDTATVKNVAHTAMLLFAGYIDAATSMSESCGGGGSIPESGWGKKDDEDERAYARRCLQMAHSMYKPKSVKRSFHR